MYMKKWIIYSLWYNMIRWDAMRCNMIWYDTIWYDTIRYDTIRYDTIRYDTIRYDTIQDNLSWSEWTFRKKSNPFCRPSIIEQLVLPIISLNDYIDHTTPAAATSSPRLAAPPRLTPQEAQFVQVQGAIFFSSVKFNGSLSLHYDATWFFCEEKKMEEGYMMDYHNRLLHTY